MEASKKQNRPKQKNPKHRAAKTMKSISKKKIELPKKIESPQK